MRVLLSSFLALTVLLAAQVARAQQDRRLNDDPAGRLQENPMIAVDSSGALIVAWSDQRNGTANPQVYLTRSSDGGFTWSPNTRASSQQARPTGGMEMGPNIAAGPGGNVVINWADIRRTPAWSFVDVCVAHSSDAGASFTGDPRVNNDTMKAQHQPALAIGGDGTVYSVWHGFPAPGEPEATPIFIARSRDGGANFEQQRRVDYYTASPKGVIIGSCNCCRPWAFTSGATNVYVAFRIDSAKIRDIFLARSTDRGETWSPAVRVSHGMWLYDACPSSGPTGAARNDTLVVAWMDQRSALEAPSVYVGRSTDGGKSFAIETRIDSNASFPSVAFDRQGRVFVTYGIRGAKGDLYCRMSSDGGRTFGERKRVNGVTPKDMNTGAASVAAPNGTVYGVWLDRRRDDGDIYFSNLTELMIPTSSVSSNAMSDEPRLAIGPNPLPTGNELLVELDGGATSAAVVDELGREVARLDPRLKQQRVSIGGSGVYFVVADFGGRRRSRAFVVVR